MKSPCYNCKYKQNCGSPREGHDCKGKEIKRKRKWRMNEVKNNAYRF